MKLIDKGKKTEGENEEKLTGKESKCDRERSEDE